MSSPLIIDSHINYSIENENEEPIEIEKMENPTLIISKDVPNYGSQYLESSSSIERRNGNKLLIRAINRPKPNFRSLVS